MFVGLITADDEVDSMFRWCVCYDESRIDQGNFPFCSQIRLKARSIFGPVNTAVAVSDSVFVEGKRQLGRAFTAPLSGRMILGYPSDQSSAQA